MASPITSSGLASGIDTNAILAQLVQIQKFPIQKLQQRQSDISTKAAKLSDLTTKLKALADAAKKLGNVGDLLSYSATTGDEGIASVTASGSASPATYSLKVLGLAKAEKNLSAGFSSSTETVAGGTLSFSINGGTANDVVIDAGDSLSTVVNKINGADAGVTATIINDGQGTPTSYKILLTASTTGYTGAASDAVTIGDSGTGLTFAESVTATNATLELDDQLVTRTTNSFSDLVTGLSFTLKGEGTTSLQVASDPDAVVDRVSEFVDAFNSAMGAVLKELKVTSDTKRSATLAGEPFMRSLQAALSAIVSKDVGDTGGPFTTLASLGLGMTQTGTLKLDEGAFKKALETNAASLAGVFTKESTGAVALFDDLVSQYTDPVDGALTRSAKTLASRKSSLSDRISTLQDRADSYETRLRNQFIAMERSIALIQSQGARMMAILGSGA